MYNGPLYPGKALAWALDQIAAREDLIVTQIRDGFVWSRAFGSDSEIQTEEKHFRDRTTDIGYKDMPIRRDSRRASR